MPSNERENRRREHQRQKEKKNKRNIWIVLIVIILILGIMKICEIDFRDVKNKIQSGSISSGIISDSYPYNIDSLYTAQVDTVNGKLSVLTDTDLTVLNTSDAKSQYSFTHGYATPIAVYSGNYICLYDQGGTRIRLDSTTENFYELNTDKNIICATVAQNGTIAYATFSDESKTKLTILNRRESSKNEIEINDGYVTSLALNSNASKCTYVTVNTSNAALVSTVHSINVATKKTLKTFDFTDTNILDLKYCSNSDVYLIGDNTVGIIKGQKKYEPVFDSNTVSVLKFTYTSSDELILNYEEFSNSGVYELDYINSNGRVKFTTELPEKAEYISSHSNEITVLNSDNISVYSLTKGELKHKIKCDNSARSVHTLSSKNFVQLGNTIDIIE